METSVTELVELTCRIVFVRNSLGRNVTSLTVKLKGKVNFVNVSKLTGGIRITTNFSDGHLLMALQESDLDELRNSTTSLHMRAFIEALYSVRTFGVKPPHDLWEYKVLLFVLFLSLSLLGQFVSIHLRRVVILNTSK